MHQISFADDAIADVVSRAKRETLRVGEDFGIDELLRFVRRNGAHVGYLRIVEKSQVIFSDLSESDVRTHNSGTLEHLQARLLSFYPALTANSVLIRYRFEFTETLV